MITMLIKIAMIIGIILLVLTTLMMAMIVGYVLYRVLDVLAEERTRKKASDERTKLLEKTKPKS